MSLYQFTMKDFIAIDFETANYCRSSVCSVGIVTVQEGEITDQLYELIHPSPNYYLPACTSIHGLTAMDTDEAPYFPEVWEKITARLPIGLPFVAHNSAFDQSCLKAVFHKYKMNYPLEYRFFCTYQAARRYFGKQLPNHQLHTVSAQCGYDLRDHHHALADAIACAHIALNIL